MTINTEVILLRHPLLEKSREERVLEMLRRSLPGVVPMTGDVFQVTESDTK